MEMEWPLILFTFFVCLASGILLAQGVLTVLGKGKQMQLASLVSSLVALAVGGISVFFHLQHWSASSTASAISPRASRSSLSAASSSSWCWWCISS